MDTNGLIKLSDLVNGLIFKDKTLKKEDWTWVFEFFIDAIRSFNMMHAYKPTHVNVTPNENFMIDFPLDMIGFGKLCVIKNGEYYPLPERENLSTSTSIINGDEVYDETKNEGTTYDPGITSGLGSTGGVYSTYFVRDYKKRRFVLNGARISDLVLIYTTSGVNTEGETYIPAEAKAMLEANVRYQLALYGDKKYTSAQLYLLQKEAEDKVLEYRSYDLTVLIDKFVDDLTSAYGLLVKR